MKKRSNAILGVILIALTIYFVLEWSSFTPTGAIRNYVFFQIDKIQAFGLSLGPSGQSADQETLGKQYFVEGVTDAKSGGGSLNFFYLKQNGYGQWYVVSCGSGP